MIRNFINKREEKMNYIFFFFVLLSITLYNHLSSVLRFADFIIAIVSIYAILRYPIYFKKYVLYFFVLILIIISSQLLNINLKFYPSAILNGIRYWTFAFIFFVLGNIIAKKLFFEQKRNNNKAIYLKIFYSLLSITVFIYLASYLQIEIIRNIYCYLKK